MAAELAVVLVSARNIDVERIEDRQAHFAVEGVDVLFQVRGERHRAEHARSAAGWRAFVRVHGLRVEARV